MRTDLASRLAREWLASDHNRLWKELTGSTILVDISGFTRLTELLQDHGQEGVELLHRALTLCFSAVLGPSLAAGGDVIGFAGDAALVWFSGEDHPIRAAESAAAIPHSLAHLPAAVTGGRRMRVSVGAHTGTVLAVLPGNKQRDLILFGPEMSKLVRLEAAAESGHVLFSPELAELVPSSLCGQVTEIGVSAKLQQPSVAKVYMSAMTATPDEEAERIVAERWLSLVSPSVRPLVLADDLAGDHRSTTAGFLQIPGIDAMLRTEGPEHTTKVIDNVVRAIERIGDELSVVWLDSDIGDGVIKFLLSAGTPLSVVDDEGRMLLALRRLLDESEVPLRAGTQRGKVFAGCLGVTTRRTYCVLGDPVNVAARALGLAKDGELIAADGLSIKDRSGTVSDPLGAISLKNREVPVEMWRVHQVEPPPVASDEARGPTQQDLRQEQPARLRLLWREASAGNGSSVFISGEAGMGASQMLTNAAATAGSSATVLGSDVYRRQVPYGTVSQLVRSLAVGAGRQVAEDGWDWLASFAPGLNHPTSDWLADAESAIRTPRLHIADPESGAERAKAALADLITEAAPRPWLLCLDDVEGIDSNSIGVLDKLIDRATSEPWLILAAGHNADYFDEHHAAFSEPMVLRPLGHKTAEALVKREGPSLRQDQVDKILVAGNGNPFVLTELARNPHSGDQPDSLERLGTVQIDALPVEVRRLVREASPFGLEVPLSDLAIVLGDADLKNMNAWTAAAPILTEIRPGVVGFRHEIYRRVAYQALTVSERRRLHGAIADHLANRPGTSPGVLALHYEEAGREREAFPLTLAAARAAESHGALAETSDLLVQAIRLAERVDRAAVGDLLARFGDMKSRQADFDAAEQSFSRASRVIRDPIGYALMCSKRADMAIRRGRYGAARGFAGTGLMLTAPFAEQESTTWSRLLLDEAAALHYIGSNDDAIPLAEAALEAGRKSSNRVLEGRANLHLEMSFSALGQSDSRLHGAAAIEIFSELGHDRFLTEALSNCGYTSTVEGRWDEAINLYQQAAKSAARTGDPVNAAVVAMNEGFLLTRQERHHEAVQKGRDAFSVFDRSELELPRAYAQYLLGLAAMGQDDLIESKLMFETARAGFLKARHPAMVFECDVALMTRFIQADDPSQALVLGESIAGQVDLAEPAAQLTYRIELSTALALTGDRSKGYSILLETLKLASTQGMLYEELLCLNAITGPVFDSDSDRSGSYTSRRVELRSMLGISD